MALGEALGAGVDAREMGALGRLTEEQAGGADALAPSLIWVTELESLGIEYGALITPTFADLGLDAALSALDQRGGSVSAGSFGVGDLFVQPVWLGLTRPATSSRSTGASASSCR